MSQWVVHNTDCLAWLRENPDVRVDALVCDPPYGVAHRSGWSSHLYGDVARQWGGASIANDADTSARDAMLAWWNARGPAAIFGTWKRPKPVGTRAVLVWDKGGASGMGDLRLPWKPSWEEIYIMGSGWSGFRGEGVLKGHRVPPRISMGRVHPNEKPVSLLRDLIGKLPEGATILDPFCGSGTTGVACVQTGRNFIGIEIDEGYAAIARKRIAESVPLCAGATP
jgi:hypothetical protein